METQVRDLWPTDIAVVNFLTPAAILREQAALLGQKTNNLIEAEVVTGPHTDDSIMHKFNLVVPAMDHYRYRLFLVNHGVDLYPLDIYFGSGPGPFATAVSEEEFIGHLKSILSSERTKKVIQALLGQLQS